jgi:hypothetical protein
VIKEVASEARALSRGMRQEGPVSDQAEQARDLTAMAIVTVEVAVHRHDLSSDALDKWTQELHDRVDHAVRQLELEEPEHALILEFILGASLIAGSEGDLGDLDHAHEATFERPPKERYATEYHRADRPSGR